MKKTALLGTLVLAALSAVAASARIEAQPSGDTCTASGSGPVYTLHITLPPGAQQFGFAFGARGAAITNAVIPGANGNFTTQGLAANTNGVWLSDAPLPATNNVTLTTTGKATSLTVVPASTAQPVYFSPITCRFTSGTGLQQIGFSINHHAVYNAHAGAWGLVVTIPAGGIVSAQQLVPTVGTGGAAAVTPKPLVQAHRVATKSGGKVTLMLRPTSKAMTALRTSAALHVRLKVTLDAADGRAATKLLSLTLSK